jgi:hypothetical protein
MVETINEGWNILTGIDVEKTTNAIINWFPQKKNNSNPIFGNGKTSNAIMDHLTKLLE